MTAFSRSFWDQRSGLTSCEWLHWWSALRTSKWSEDCTHQHKARCPNCRRHILFTCQSVTLSLSFCCFTQPSNLSTWTRGFCMPWHWPSVLNIVSQYHTYTFQIKFSLQHASVQCFRSRHAWRIYLRQGLYDLYQVYPHWNCHGFDQYLPFKVNSVFIGLHVFLIDFYLLQ